MSILPRESDPDADGSVDDPSRDTQRSREQGQDGLSVLNRGVSCDVTDHDDEFISTETRHQAARSENILSFRATSTTNSLPAVCPHESLMILKLSRSCNMRAGAPSAPLACRACSR